MVKCVARLDCMEEPDVGLENMAVEWDGNRKALAEEQVEEILEGHARELDKLRDSFKARESKSIQEHDKGLVKREQLRTEREENYFRYHNLLSSVCPLALANVSGEDSSEELVSKLQLLYENT